MKPIPQALKEKLLNRVKADSTASMPSVRLIATQTSVNTYLSEPIHEDIAPAFGDVTVRQMAGDPSLACAYAICLDDGVAQIYRRQFPANIDFKWEYLWTFGPASDVAIEYNGTWQLDAGLQWYYLQTEEYPYIFTVEEDDLYVQHWNDATTRTFLASGVSQISACKGWQNSIDRELDQGLIIGYLREGRVCYRALCMMDTGNYSWEAEKEIEELGEGNTSLSVIRTNDFRIGFLTEQNGRIRLVLSTRNYAGMSVRPETLQLYTNAKFSFVKKRERFGYSPRERMDVQIGQPFFNFDTSPESPEIALLRAEKLNREDAFTSYGCKFILDKPFTGRLNSYFKSNCRMSLVTGGSSVSSSISEVEIDEAENALMFYFSADIPRTCQITISTIQTRLLTYERLPGQRWFVPAFSAVFEAETKRVDVDTPSEAMSVSASATMRIDIPVFHTTVNNETLVMETVAHFEFSPVASLPI